MPGEPHGARFEDVDGVRVHFTDTGEPGDAAGITHPAVVLVHGFGATLETWVEVAPALAASHRVVALDLKGFGWTDRPPGDYSPDAQARVVLGLLARRGIERFAIVAHSWGSAIALAMSQRSRDRVSRIALYDAWVYEDQIPALFHLARTEGLGEMLFGMFYASRADERLAYAFHDPRHVTPALVARVEEGFRRPGAAAAALAGVRGQRFAIAERLYGSIATPTLILWGREDRIAQLKHGERLAHEMPNARLVTYRACGHFPMLEVPEASTRDLSLFLDEDRRR